LSWFDGDRPIGGYGKLVTLLLRLAMPAVWGGDRFGDHSESERGPRVDGEPGAYSIRRVAEARAVSLNGDENLTLTLVQGTPSHERPPPTSFCTQKEDPMNANQFNEKWMEFKGELKQQWGKFTDEDLQQVEGFLDRFIVKVQERYGYGEEKRELMKWADVWHQKSAPEAIGEKSH
jgi:uncharacterized protein YjbJ (UPF0337 family)